MEGIIRKQSLSETKEALEKHFLLFIEDIVSF